MRKLLSILQAIAAVIAKLNPMPLLDAIEQEYGRTARLVVIAVVVIIAVTVMGYNADGVLAWAGLQ
ncbi:MAG: hypothetical protein BWY71_02202 [Planctomycetes bacterium ADurb.Bin412]|nr:MAG: hypothetical protein BWY71_02202 [Planctomycetes bacterium ADurb.Bin412]